MAKITIDALSSGTPPPLDGNEVIAIVRAGSTKNAKLNELPVSTPTDTAINNAVSPLNDFREWSASRTYLSDTPVFYLGEPYKPNSLDMPIAGESPATHPAKWTKTGGGGSVIGNISPDPDGSKGAVGWTGTVATIANGLTGFDTELAITANSVWTIQVPAQLRGEALELNFEAYVNSGTGITVKMYSDSGATVEIPMTQAGLNPTGKTAFVGKFWAVGSSVYLKVAGTAFDLRMTNIYVGRPESIEGAVISTDISWAPTIHTGTIGTPTVNTAMWKRVGGDIKASWRLKSGAGGTAGSGYYEVSLPYGTIDLSKKPVGSVIGIAKISTNADEISASTIHGVVVVASASAVFVQTMSEASDSLMKHWGSAFFSLSSNPLNVSLDFEYPCAQLTSSMTIVGMNEPFFLSNSESVVNTNGVAGKAQVGTWAPILANTASTYYDLTLPRPLMLGEKPKIILRSKVDGSCVSAELAGFTVSGISYQIANLTAGGNQYGIQIVKTTSNQVRVRFGIHASNNSGVNNLTWTQFLTAADGYDAWMVEISRGGEAWAVPPKIVVSAKRTTTQALTANVTDIVFDTEVTDTNNAWNGTSFVAPAIGWYDLDVAKYTSSTAGDLVAYIAGVANKVIATCTAGGVAQGGTRKIYMTQGQALTFRASGTGTLGAGIEIDIMYDGF